MTSKQGSTLLRMHRIDHVLAWAMSTPWAILPERGTAIVQVLSRRASGVRLSDAEVEAAVGESRAATVARISEHRQAAGQGIAVIPVFGMILHRAYEVAGVSGGGLVSLERFNAAFRAAHADPAVGSIVLDIDSPGGSVGGVAETAALIGSAEKPVVAVANSMAASAAYWVAAAARELVVTPSGSVGSIGVYSLHEDHSKELEEMGVAISVVKAGKFKAEGLPIHALTDEARAARQKSVDEFYDMFVKGVAQGRGVKASAVRSGFGEGRVVNAREALSLGMVDRVATLEETIQRLAAGGRVKPRQKAEAAYEVLPGEAAEAAAAAPAPEKHLAAAVESLDDLTIRERELDLTGRSPATDPAKQGPTFPGVH